MCYNCLLVELKIKSYFIKNKVSLSNINYLLRKYKKECFKNNKNKIMNYVLYNLDLNPCALRELELYTYLDNIIKS